MHVWLCREEVNVAVRWLTPSATRVTRIWMGATTDGSIAKSTPGKHQRWETTDGVEIAAVGDARDIARATTGTRDGYAENGADSSSRIGARASEVGVKEVAIEAIVVEDGTQGGTTQNPRPEYTRHTSVPCVGQPRRSRCKRAAGTSTGRSAVDRELKW